MFNKERETVAAGCEWTMRALHAEAVAAARRGVPPTWMALGPERREALVTQNWNRACGALAAGEHHMRTGKFVGAGEFADEVAAAKAVAAAAEAAAAEAAAVAAVEAAVEAADAAAEAAEAEEAAAAASNGTNTTDTSNGTTANAAAAEDSDSPPPPPASPASPSEPSEPPEPPEPPMPPPAVKDPAAPGFNVTRGIVSVCALLRLDARAHAHLLGMIVEAGIHPFPAAEVREACVLVTGSTECRGASYAVPALDVDDEGEGGAGAGVGRRRSEL
jgi:hypothetical protein